MQQECSESAGEQKITRHKSNQRHLCQMYIMSAKNLTLPMFVVDVCVCLIPLCVHYIYYMLCIFRYTSGGVQAVYFGA